MHFSRHRQKYQRELFYKNTGFNLINFSVEIPYSKTGRKSNLKVSKDHLKCSVGSIIPLPAKKCNECRKSCRVAPLIACDFCPLLFHLDCLDPPLTTPPSGRWMCPNHVEHCLVNEN